MRALFIFVCLFLLPATLFPAGARLQTPGSRAAWGVWTSGGYYAGQAWANQRNTFCRERSRAVFRSGGWYTARHSIQNRYAAPVTHGQPVYRAKTSAARCYGYSGRYRSQVIIHSIRDYRIQRGATIGAR